MPVRAQALQQRATCRTCRRNGARRTSSGCRSTRPTPSHTRVQDAGDRWRNGSKRKGAAPKATLIDGTSATGRAYAARARRRTCSSSIPRATFVYNGAHRRPPHGQPGRRRRSPHNYVRAALTEAMAGKPVTVATTSPYGCSVEVRLAVLGPSRHFRAAYPFRQSPGGSRDSGPPRPRSPHAGPAASRRRSMSAKTCATTPLRLSSVNA